MLTMLTSSLILWRPWVWKHKELSSDFISATYSFVTLGFGRIKLDNKA